MGEVEEIMLEGEQWISDAVFRRMAECAPTSQSDLAACVPAERIVFIVVHFFSNNPDHWAFDCHVFLK